MQDICTYLCVLARGGRARAEGYLRAPSWTWCVCVCVCVVQVSFLQQQVDEAVAQGARLISGGSGTQVFLFFFRPRLGTRFSFIPLVTFHRISRKIEIISPPTLSERIQELLRFLLLWEIKYGLPD